MINHFNSNVAVSHGINAAIFIQALSQWTFNNLANKRHLYDGHCWSFNTLEAYEVIFPWWNRRQLETLINNLVKEGLILKGNYNKHKYDRTCWYALTYKCLNFYPELMTPELAEPMLGTISQKCEMETLDFGGNTFLENHFTKMRNGNHENVTPIPTNNTTNKKDISNDISRPNVNGDKDKSEKQNSKYAYETEDLIADNPHNIPEQMLYDWMAIRKSKKAKVTKTAWDKINKTLIQIQQEAKLSPIAAFEAMVANCWQSLDVKYFKDDEKRKGNASPKQDYV